MNLCMLSGLKFLMMTSFMPISMELSSSVLMELKDTSILGFIPTLLIILKSYLGVLNSHRPILKPLNRVLLATIRSKGLCPCPRCLVSKSDLDRLGLRRDISIRIDKFREFMADTVKIAQRAIYNLAKSIHSTAVKDLLKSFSGVPTSASIFLL